MYLYHIYLLYIEVPKVNYTLPYFMILYSARVRPTPLGFSLSPESVRKNPGITLPYPTAIPDKRSCSSGHPALRYFYPLLQYGGTYVRVKCNVYSGQLRAWPVAALSYLPCFIAFFKAHSRDSLLSTEYSYLPFHSCSCECRIPVVSRRDQGIAAIYDHRLFPD